MQIFLILSLLISIALILFAVQNAAIVTVSFLSFHYNGSLALILVAVFTLGVLCGILISIPSLLKKSSALREQRKRAKQLEEGMAANRASLGAGQEGTDGH
ncbi:MAG TPA: LapA family protein [Thermodesulfovibrionales bacterium]|nr:LapA family protein [Thermodesulfovibrionales bacterium]